MHQLSFSDASYTYKKKTTRKEHFLREMDSVLPWDELLQPILRKYPKPGQGRRPIPAATMLRIYFMQQWYGLSDPGMEDSLYDVEPMRRFAGVGLDAIPDETTICKFRHFLERHGLTEVLFERTGQYLSDRGLIVREGTIVDATILAAPTSTKNRDQARDPQMGSTRKGTTWHFGLKAHVGSDVQGRVHTVVVTSASVHDSQRPMWMPNASRTPKPKGSNGASCVRPPAGGNSPVRINRLTERVTAHAPGSNIPLASSSTCGAIAKCVIEA